MPTFRYQHPADNLADGLTPTVASGTVDTTYGVAGLTDGNLYSPCKFVGTSATLQWDFGSAQTVCLPVLMHTNLDGTVQVQVSDDVTFLSGVDTFVLQTHEQDPDGFRDHMWRDLSADISPRRYCRLAMTGNSNAIILGEVWLGRRVRQLTHDPARGVTRGEQRLGLIQRTAGGIELKYDLGVRSESVRTMTIITTRGVGERAVRDWYRAARGAFRSFPLIDSLTGRALFVRFDVPNQTLAPKTVSPTWSTFVVEFLVQPNGLAWSVPATAPSPSVSPSASESPSPSLSGSPSASPSPSSSHSPSLSPSPSGSPSSSHSPSASGSPSASTSPTGSPSSSHSPSASGSPSGSVSPSASTSLSQSPSASVSRSTSPSASKSPSSSASPSASPSSSHSPSGSASPSKSPSASVSPS